MNARTALSTLTFGALLLLTACTSPAVEPPGLTASPTTTPTPSPTPEPTPTDGIQVHSDPEAGIFFEEVPDLSGDEAEVYNWIATYQKAYWQTLRTNELSGTLASIASADMQATLQQIATDNAASGVRVTGTFRTRITDIVVTGDTATGVKCDDLREATFATAEHEWTPTEVGTDVPERGTVELTRLDGGVWYINNVLEAGSC